jgi:DNA-binding response OmpR family regulator
MLRVVVVEDDVRLGQQVVECLQAAAFEPSWIRTGTEALEARFESYGLIILDLMLPGAHGLDVLKHVRASSDVPVLVLSARNDTHDMVRALQLGADDYVTKPFWPDELLARIQARLRRPTMRGNDTVAVGDLGIDLEQRTVSVSGASVELTKVEFELLALLARRQGAAVSRSRLVEQVLDPDREGTERTLDVHMSRLRKKLGAAGRYVVTVWGIGYRLELGPG